MILGLHWAKCSPLTYAALIYGIALALPAPRTASVTHEMAIMPFADSPYWLTSLVYFSLVLLAALNRSKLLDLFGKITTPWNFNRTHRLNWHGDFCTRSGLGFNHHGKSFWEQFVRRLSDPLTLLLP